MVHQRITTGSTVRVNCPDAKGVHGKLGIVKEFNPAGRGIYTVTMPDLQFRPSFLLFNELEVVSEAEARQDSKQITIQDVVTQYGEEDAARFAFDLLILLGYEINGEDGYDQVFPPEQ